MLLFFITSKFKTLPNESTGILVFSFYNDPKDDTLEAIIKLLHELDESEDVRPILDNRFGLKEALDDVFRRRTQTKRMTTQTKRRRMQTKRTTSAGRQDGRPSLAEVVKNAHVRCALESDGRYGIFDTAAPDPM